LDLLDRIPIRREAIDSNRMVRQRDARLASDGFASRLGFDHEESAPTEDDMVEVEALCHHIMEHPSAARAHLFQILSDCLLTIAA
jgi:hypothetical protein